MWMVAGGFVDRRVLWPELVGAQLRDADPATWIQLFDRKGTISWIQLAGFGGARGTAGGGEAEAPLGKGESRSFRGSRLNLAARRPQNPWSVLVAIATMQSRSSGCAEPYANAPMPVIFWPRIRVSISSVRTN